VKKKLINIRDFLKRSHTTHTLQSASVVPEADLLSDDDLEMVNGGMQPTQFSEWRAKLINNLIGKKDEMGSKKN